MEFIIANIGIIIAVIAVIVALIFLASIYKVASIDKALIITGGKEPIIKVSGGAFVIPIFRKADYFDLCMMRPTKTKSKRRLQCPLLQIGLPRFALAYRSRKNFGLRLSLSRNVVMTVSFRTLN